MIFSQFIQASSSLCFYGAMLAQSAVMRLHVIRPSVRLSVCPSVRP